jgi:Uma2 family endonuclease
MSTVPKRWLSPQEYLAQERLAEFRSEYYRGETFAMAGGSPRHSLIKSNTNRELSIGLKGRPCTVYDSDLRILVSPTGLYTYPDASVICGELEFDDQLRDTAVNPTLLAEVRSPSTEGYDRGKKFEHYQQITSLREYLLISQDSPTLERHLRNADGSWAKTVVTGLEKSLYLPSIGVTLMVAEIYDKVNFTAAPAPPQRPS